MPAILRWCSSPAADDNADDGNRDGSRAGRLPWYHFVPAMMVTMNEPVTLDDVDRRMVALLVEDGRLSINDLAGRLGVARTTAYTRFQRLRRLGVITGFTAVVDHGRLGVDVTALVLVNIDQGRWADLRGALLAVPGVEQLLFTSGAFDVVLTVRAASIAALRDVVLLGLHRVAGVKSTQTVFVLDHERAASAPN
jgi:Lrp/AsnC family leucine-responsive transcriptional regulator